MKKQFILAFVAAILSIASVNAQPPAGGQRKTVEERVKDADDKLAVLKLDKATADKVDVVLTGYYKDQQKAREDMMASGSTDRDAMRASMQKLSDDRDTKLKAIFTDDQYKKWKDEIEPSLRPQRGNRPQQ